MLSVRAPLARFAAARDGIASIEFAVVLPVMMILTLGTVEVSKYYQMDNQVVQVANMIGQMVSQLPQTTPMLNVQKIWQASPLIAPESTRMADQLGRAGWSDTLSVTITSVAFTKKDAACTAACEYEANVAWSIGTSPMSCGKLAKAPTGTKAPRGSVPEVLFSDGSAVFVDASLAYVPTLGTTYFPAGTIDESAWFRPRNTSQIKLTGAGTGLGTPRSTLCAGFN